MNFNEDFKSICEQSRLVGASVAVVKDKDIVEIGNYGYRNLSMQKPVTEDTIFRIASISKIVVTMAVLTFLDEGKLDIEDDISDILGYKIRNPYFPEKKITVQMLMTHTSSITDGYDDENPAYDNEIKGYNGVNGKSFPVSLKELLVPNDGKYYTDLTWDKNEPGTKFIYSNFGTGILACIVEALSGKLFTEYVQERILKPLEVDASFQASKIIKKEDISELYYITNNEDNPYRISRTVDSFVNFSYPEFALTNNFRGPAGGLLISMKDLSKIINVLMYDGRYNDIQILTKETVDLMLQLHWFGSGFNYKAKGLQLKIMDNFDGKIFKGHTGSAYGVISYLFFNREEKLGLCFITNGGYYKFGSKDLYDVEEKTFQLFLDKYWPTKEKKLQFTFELNSDFGLLDGRVIKFFQKPIILDNEIYLPTKALASGLNIIPIWEDKKVKLTKKDKSISLEVDNNCIMNIPLKKVLESLNISYTIKNNKVTIEY